MNRVKKIAIFDDDEDPIDLSLHYGRCRLAGIYFRQLQ